MAEVLKNFLRYEEKTYFVDLSDADKGFVVDLIEVDVTRRPAGPKDVDLMDLLTYGEIVSDPFQKKSLTVIPEKCHLWTKDWIKSDDFYQLVLVERYLDDDHHKRQLMRCPDCGQHYYKEFFETIDWVNGNDPQYRTYVPIVPTTETIDLLNSLDSTKLNTLVPILVDLWPAEGDRIIKWVGK